MASRYEYRGFAPDFGIVERRMREGGEPTAIRESREVYLVSRDSEKWNIKFRNGQLDVKKLIDRSGEFEQWEPQVKIDLPVATDSLCEILAPTLGLSQNDLLGGNKVLPFDELLGQLHANCPQVVIVDLFKRRFGFEIGDCLAEMAEVRINGAAIRTACIESTNLAELKRLAYSLGLDVYRNVSYVRALQRVTGLIRDPLF